jgi:hypothetical protein
MSPILQQLIQMNDRNKARESKRGMDPMEALARMIAQGRMPEDIIPQRPTRPDPYPEPKPIPEPVIEPDYELPMMPNMPERPIYPEPYIDTPQDYVGPLGAIGSAIGQQAQRRYNQDAMGNQVEIGYDGTPLANYTPDQMAIHNAIKGVTPSQSRYVYNGEGYDLVPNEPQYPQYPEEPTRPIDYYNPSPPIDYTEDPGTAPMPTPIGPEKSLAGDNIKQMLEDSMRAYIEQQKFDSQQNPYDQYRD